MSFLLSHISTVSRKVAHKKQIWYTQSMESTLAKVLDGRKLADETLVSLKQRVATLGTIPHISIVVASQDAPSVAYAKMKQKWAAKIGRTHNLTT
jgi:hypothetical protein